MVNKYKILTGLFLALSIVFAWLFFLYLNNNLFPTYLSNPPRFTEAQAIQYNYDDQITQPSPNRWVTLSGFFIAYFSFILFLGLLRRSRGEFWTFLKKGILHNVLIFGSLVVGVFLFISDWPDFRDGLGAPGSSLVYIGFFSLISLPLFYFQPLGSKPSSNNVVNNTKTSESQIAGHVKNITLVNKIIKRFTIFLGVIFILSFAIPYSYYYLFDPQKDSYTGFEPGYLWVPLMAIMILLPIIVIITVINVFLKRTLKNDNLS